MSQENVQRIKELEHLLRNSEEVVKLAEQWEKLKSNPLFRKLVLENYLEKLATELVHRMAEPSYEKIAEDIQKSMIGVAEFKQYIDMIEAQKSAALIQIHACRSELDYARGEAE